MSRRELREQIFKFIFRAEFYDTEELQEQEQLFFETFAMEEQEIRDEDAQYISAKSNKIIEKLDELDGMINQRQRAGRHREWQKSISRFCGLQSMRLSLMMMFPQELPSTRQWSLPSGLGRKSPPGLSTECLQNLRNNGGCL